MIEQTYHSSPKIFRDHFFTVVNLIPFFVGLASTILWFFPNKKYPEAVLTTFFVCIVWIAILGVRAYKAFRSPEVTRVPRPALLWQFLFNQLPISVGSVEQTENLMTILLISDPSGEEMAHKIKDAFKILDGKHLFRIDPIPIRSNLRNLTTRLKSKDPTMEVDAIYQVLTDSLFKNKKYTDAINVWSHKHSARPILSVNCLTDPNEYNRVFDYVSKECALSGVGKLITRSSVRGIQWRSQATSFWKIGWTAIALLVIIGIASTIAINALFVSHQEISKDLSNHKQVLESRDALGTRNIEAFVKTLGEHRGLLFEMGLDNSPGIGGKPAKNARIRSEYISKTRALLDSYALFSLNDFTQRYTGGQNLNQLTIWREYEYEGKKYSIQVASSTPRDMKCFPNLENSNFEYIINGAMTQEVYVLWKSNFALGEIASWDLNGDPFGTWNSPNQDGKIIFNNKKTSFLSTLPKDDKRFGLLCVGAATAGVRSGVCLDTPGSAEFLSEGYSRQFLLHTLSVIHLIPSEFLIDDATKLKMAQGCPKEVENSVVK